MRRARAASSTRSLIDIDACGSSTLRTIAPLIGSRSVTICRQAIWGAVGGLLGGDGDAALRIIINLELAGMAATGSSNFLPARMSRISASGTLVRSESVALHSCTVHASNSCSFPPKRMDSIE
eukprot:6339337-Prymnesium_polylepis.1